MRLAWHRSCATANDSALPANPDAMGRELEARTWMHADFLHSCGLNSCEICVFACCCNLVPSIDIFGHGDVNECHSRHRPPTCPFLVSI